MLLKTYLCIRVEEIVLGVDAQIVLSWLLADPCQIRTKSLYARNRCKDIKLMLAEIKDLYGLEIKYKYVSTGDNPADMLSHGINLEKFIGDMDKWLHGPKWLNDDQACWPEHELNCITP